MVEVRATAANSYGSALEPSEVNTVGTLIKRRPDKMGMLTEVSSTDNTIEVRWSELEGDATGNS